MIKFDGKAGAVTARDYARRGIVAARKFGKNWRLLEVELREAGEENHYFAHARRPECGQTRQRRFTERFVFVDN
jgi:hypothetical protein